jgi:hypothetical protein
MFFDTLRLLQNRFPAVIGGIERLPPGSRQKTAGKLPRNFTLSLPFLDRFFVFLAVQFAG